MDLRSLSISPTQLARIRRFIVERKLGYQPFIFQDELEVGAGLHFIEHCQHYQCVPTQDADPSIAGLRTTRPDEFRASNAQLRQIYELFLNFMQAQLGDLSTTSFAEVGSNTGYFLFGLALRGARRCVGVDFTRADEVFALFNSILGTNCESRY